MATEKAVPVSKLVGVFIKMRDKRDALRKEFDQKEADIQEQMDMVKAELLAICDATGGDSIRTANGTAIRSVKTRYWSTDWESMHAFMVKEDALDLLERRIHQSNMKEFLQNYPDKLPPGLNADSHYEITVRRK
jgi:hypothetical protein